MTNNKAIKLIRDHITMLKDHPITYDDGGWGSHDIFDALNTAIGALEELYGGYSIEDWNKQGDAYVWYIRRNCEWFVISKNKVNDWELCYYYFCKRDDLRFDNFYSSSDIQECVEYAMRYAKENLYDR